MYRFWLGIVLATVFLVCFSAGKCAHAFPLGTRCDMMRTMTCNGTSCTYGIFWTCTSGPGDKACQCISTSYPNLCSEACSCPCTCSDGTVSWCFVPVSSWC